MNYTFDLSRLRGQARRRVARVLERLKKERGLPKVVGSDNGPEFRSRHMDQWATIIAPLPPSLQDRCLAAPAMIAHVITGKYCDHLPLYRQEDILWRRHKIPLPRQTMMGWLDLAEFWLRPIYELIKTTVMDGNYVQVDETPVRYLCPGHGKTKLG